jgi:ATP-dependent protease Clp ATPase subunit
MKIYEDQACSFCKKSASHTQHMFSGPGMNIRICGECVTFAKQLLLDNPNKENQGDCSFCGRTKAQVKQLIFGPGVNICSECVTFAGQQHDGDDSASAKTSWFTWRGILSRVRNLIHGHRIESVTSEGV